MQAVEDGGPVLGDESAHDALRKRFVEASPECHGCDGQECQEGSALGTGAPLA